MNKCILLHLIKAFIHHFRTIALDPKKILQYNQISRSRKDECIKMLLSFFQLALAIHNVWPQRMSLKAFIILYFILLLSAMPVTILSCIPYGLFGILAAACIYGLSVDRNTAPQNVGMTMIGFVLTVIIDNLLKEVMSLLIPAALSDYPIFSFGIFIIRIFLFYLLTLYCGRLLNKTLLSGKGILSQPQTWYVADGAMLLLITIYLFDNIIPGQDGSLGKLIYNNALHILGYLLVMLFLLLAMRHSYREKMQTEAKSKAWQDLQDYTRNLEVMNNGLRSFKHDYINILLSLYGYVENGDRDELKEYFENKILPTKNLIDQGDYKLNQLGNINVVEIKSLLAAKMIYAHESGIDVTIDIPDSVDDFGIDTIDLARILGIFLDNAIEAALATEHPQIGLNIIQNTDSISIIIRNGYMDKGEMLHQLKQKGFSTKTGHQGIGLSNADNIINAYENVMLETVMENGSFIQHMNLAKRKE